VSERVLVVIPTYNEAASIETVINRALASSPDVNVLIVDDASPDGTAELVRDRFGSEPRVSILNRPSKRGLGRAYVAGFHWGLERGYERFVEMDGDLSHDPAAIPVLLAATEEADLAVGSRYIDGGEIKGWSRSRTLLSKAGNMYSRVALGFGVRDSTSGFRCYRRELLEEVGFDHVKTDGYGFQIDMAYRAWRHGFRIKEVPITFIERVAGVSKISRAIVLEAVLLVALWGLRDLILLRRRPGKRPAADLAGSPAQGSAGSGRAD
jgi:dolichol-phosphate mannosyltransferase